MRLRLRLVSVIVGVGCALGACGFSSGHPGVITFSKEEISKSIEASGLPQGFVRAVRSGPDAARLHVEWVTDREVFLVELKHAHGSDLQVVRRVSCSGWKCFANGDGELVAWLEAASGLSPVTVHVGRSVFPAKAAVVDKTGRYFAIQEAAGVRVGTVTAPTDLKSALEMALKAMFLTPDGPMVIGSDGAAIVAQTLDEDLRPRGAVLRVPVSFAEFEVTDYSSTPQRILILELRDDPLCSRLWTWPLEGISLVGGECAGEANTYSD